MATISRTEKPLRGRTFASLRKHRNYRLFFAGQLVSVAGTWMQDTALPWLVLERTHSPVQVGLLLFCRFLPFTFLALFAGVLADRYDNRRLMLVTQASSMLIAAALAVVVLTDGPLVAIFVLATLGGAAVVLDAPNRQALTFQLVGRDELPNAVALNSGLFNAGRVVGPAVAGVIIATVGVGACFVLNALSFLAVLAALVAMRTEELYKLNRAVLERGSGAIRQGLSYVRRTPQIRLVIGVTAVVGLLGFNFRVLVPVFTSKTLDAGPRTLGVLFAAFGAGALAGALLSATSARPRWRYLLGGLTGLGVGMLALAFLTSVWVSALMLAALGLCFTLWAATSQSIIQLTAADMFRGRVVSLFLLAFGGLTPVGSLITGWLSDVGGTKLAFLVAGTSTLATVAYGSVRLSKLKAPEPERRPVEYVEPPL